PKTDPQALAKLADDPDPKVRAAVAANPNTPDAVLARLPETKPDRLAVLLGDKDAKVRAAAAANPSTPSEALFDLAEGVRRPAPKRGPAPPPSWVHPPTKDADVLKVLAGHPEARVRWAAADNPNTPPESLKKLAEDP